MMSWISQIVAYAVWQFPHDLSREQMAEKDDLSARIHEEPPPGYDQGLDQEFFSAIRSAHDRLVDDRKDYSMICTFPCLPFAEELH